MFIGQEHLWRQLDYLIPEMMEGRNFNILLRAPSGWGKSKMAIAIANQVSPDSVDYNIPDENGNVLLDLEKRIIIIDEVHTLEQPEIIYPLMDRGEHIFILCSNEFGQLLEPLVNRCINLTFEEYSDLEIGAIISHDFELSGINVNDQVLSEIIRNCNNNPRITRQIAERLAVIFKRNERIPETTEEIRDILVNILQLQNGLNPLHRRYLAYLEKVGRASLDAIIFATRLDKRTILQEVEPILIQRNKIYIDSRGRHLL